MKYRCTNNQVSWYKYYGGRGIKYDPAWETFEQFAKDMFPSWAEGATLDRVDTDGDYTKENCRWVTLGENLANKRPYKGREVKGVYWKKKEQKWTARTDTNALGISKSLYWGDSYEDACKARKSWEDSV